MKLKRKTPRTASQVNSNKRGGKFGTVREAKNKTLLLTKVLVAIAIAAATFTTATPEATAQAGSRVCYNNSYWVEADSGSCSSFWIDDGVEERTFQNKEVTCEDWAEIMTGTRFDICLETSRANDVDSNSCTRQSYDGGRNKPYRVYSSCVQARVDVEKELPWTTTQPCGVDICTKGTQISLASTDSWSLGLTSTAALNGPLFLGFNQTSTKTSGVTSAVTESSGCKYLKGETLRWRATFDFRGEGTPDFRNITVDLECDLV